MTTPASPSTPAVPRQIGLPNGESVGWRRATAADALCLAMLATQVFLDTYAPRGVNPTLAREVQEVVGEAAIRERLAKAELWVAERDGHMLGYMDLDPHTRCPVATVAGLEVVRLYVLRGFQRLGLGRSFLDLAQARARELGLDSVWLTAWEDNHSARRFYAELGFQDLGATDYTIHDQTYVNRVLARAHGGAGW